MNAKTAYWFVLGTTIYKLMKAGRYASAARLVRAGLEDGIFEPDNAEGSSWRTSILMNYRFEEI